MTTYDLHFGANLISFPSADAVDLATAIPDDVEGAFTGVIGEGVAASPNPVLGWVGSLSNFEGGKGYWAKVDAAIQFEFIVDEIASRAQETYSAEFFHRACASEDWGIDTAPQIYAGSGNSAPRPCWRRGTGAHSLTEE